MSSMIAVATESSDKPFRETSYAPTSMCKSTHEKIAATHGRIASSWTHLHVLNGVNRHASHANVTGNTAMVGIIAPMCCEVECDTQPLLPCG